VPVAVLLAHGIGGRTDLPLSVWMFGYGAAAALVVSFAALAIFWPEARLEPVRRGAAKADVTPVAGDDDPAGRTGPGGLVLRALGVVAFVVVLAAAAIGDDLVSRNLAPAVVYIAFWVGLTVVCGLVVDVWNAGLDPFPTIAGPLVGKGRPYRLGHWPAAVGLAVFVWVELVYPHRAEPRFLAVAIVAYTVAVLAGAMVWGRPWLRRGEAFAAWFGLLGHLAPVGRDGDGRWRLRPPLVGLARLVPDDGTVALVLVALGSTAFDGVTRSTSWNDLVGTRSTTEVVPLATLGLLVTIAFVAALYLGSMRVASSLTRRPTRELAHAFVHSLVPIALAYAIAHYFSLLVLEGQAVIALVSDPLNRGWALFGTVDRPIDYTLVSPNAIAYVQVASIVAGHVAGVVLAHDRALARLPKAVATKSQYPLLVAMVAFTVGGLALLLGG
jgi:hypothetical protein